MEPQEAWKRLEKALLSALNTVLRRWASQRLHRAYAGATRVYVELEEGWCGSALTPTWLAWHPLRIDPSTATPRQLARLAGRTANPLAAAYAVAAVNAATAAYIASTPGAAPKPLRPGEEPEALGASRGARVVMLGYMPGLARTLINVGARIILVADYARQLLERAISDGYTVTWAGDLGRIRDAIAGSDLVVFSGSAVLDPPTLLAETRWAREAGATTALVGPTSSFHPAVARELGVDKVLGAYVDPRLCPRLAASTAAGGGLRGVRGRLVYWAWG